MSREKQIEEIKRDIFAAFGGYEKWEEDWQSLAEAVYNAGYRKQSEGEWYKIDGFLRHHFCNQCGKGNRTKSNYCPNCGAKMKGGE